MELKHTEILTNKSEVNFSEGKVTKVEEIDNVLHISFQQESDDVINKWIITLTRDQFSHIAREVNVKPLSNEQLKAIHSKKVEEPAKVSVVTEPVVEMTIPVKITNPKKYTHLPTQDEPPMNWKNKEPEREARRIRSRIDESKVSCLLDFIFKWHKNNQYKANNKTAKYSLAHLLKTHIPTTWHIDFQTCRRIYLGQSYKEVTSAYRLKWIGLVSELKARGFHTEVPDYIRKHYSV